MERIETDRTADANGYVHVHVGPPGTRVHMVIDPTAGVPAQADMAGVRAAFGAWKDYDFVRPDQGEWRDIAAIWPEAPSDQR